MHDGEIDIQRAVADAAHDVVAAHAASVDREGAFPSESLDALAAAGLLGVMSAADVGGRGLGLRGNDSAQVLVGKHGDHIGGERDAAKALAAGRVDAACVIDGAQTMFTRDGTLAPGSVRVLAQTPPYDHCNLTVLDDAPAEAVGRFRELLLGMSYDDPVVRPLLDLEGLKAWKDGRTTGYAQLEAAVDRFRYLDPWLATMRR